MNNIVDIFFWSMIRLALVLSWFCCASNIQAEQQDRFVSLVLERVSITNDIENHVTMVRCIFNVHNETGEVLSVKTFFQSPFDDIELIVLGDDGKTIAQQKFSHPQFPTTFEGRELPVQKGENTAILGYPLIGHEELFAKNDKIKLRLVGKLTGSKYTRLLASNTIDAPTARRIYAPKLSDPNAMPWRVKTMPALRLPEDLRQ